MHMSIFSLNSLYDRRPYNLGNISHVEAFGRHGSSVNRILGIQLKPAAGSSDIKSLTETGVPSHSATYATYSFQWRMTACFFRCPLV